MKARYHGEQPTNLQMESFAKATLSADTPPTVGFMFGNLTNKPENRLPEGEATISAIGALGRAMAEDPSGAESTIPAAYTYFGQFIDHDITKTVFDASIQPPGGPDPIQAVNFQPIPRADVSSLVKNLRTAALDLDSVYQGFAQEAVETNGKFRLGVVAPSGFFPITMADRDHDLPRMPMLPNPQNEAENELDRKAIIGDPRNDENLLVAQLHLAFLRSHNILIDRGLDHTSAQTAIRRRYQWAVLHDFLPRVCDKNVVDDVLTDGASVWNVENRSELFMPVEFSAAAYRFGHSMIRGKYSHNSTFTDPPEGKVPATFNFFFTFTALSGDLQPGAGPNFEFESLPDNWPIEWHRYFDSDARPARNPARRIDASLTPELGNLRDFQGIPITDVMAKLASRNLLRGYLLGLPTGQAVADLLGVPRLSRDVLLSAIPLGLTKLVDDAGLLDRTPLWFYILAEAGNPAGPDGQHLGVVGSRIVAETLWNLAKHAQDSVVADPPTAADLATGEFTLRGLIKMGQDTAMPPL